MVNMEMRQHNVLDILWSKAQSGDLAYRCFLQITRHSVQSGECAHKTRWVSVVSESQTGINQHKAISRLDEQAMSDGRGSQMEGHTVQMVNSHRLRPGSHRQSIIRYFIAMPCREVRQLRVGRVAFVGDVSREGAGVVGQQTLLAHPRHVVDELPRT